MAGSKDVSINIKAKSDPSSIAKTVREFEAGISRLKRIDKDSANPLIKTLSTIRDLVSKGFIDTQSVSSIGALLVKQGLSAQTAAVQIRAYTAELARASKSNKTIKGILDQQQKQQETKRKSLLSLGNAISKVTSFQRQVTTSGISGSKTVGDKLERVKKGLLSGELSTSNDSVKNLIKELEALESSAIDSGKSLAKVNNALSNFVDNTTHIKVSSEGNIFEKLVDQKEAIKAIETMRNGVSDLINEVMDADPENSGLIETLEKLDEQLKTGNLDGKKIAVLKKTLTSAAASVSTLGNSVSSKLSPKLLEINDQLETIESKQKKVLAPDGVSKITDEIGNMSSAAGSFLQSLQKVGDYFPKLGSMLKSGPMIAITAIVSAAVASVEWALGRLKAAMVRAAEMDMKVLAQKGEIIDIRKNKESRETENAIKGKQERITQQRAIEDTQLARERAMDEVEKAGELATAQSEKEKEEIERRYSQKENARQAREKRRQVEREKEDTILQVGDDESRITNIDKDTARREKLRQELLAKRKELYAQSNEKLEADPSIMKSMKSWFEEAFGQKLEGETADQMLREIDNQIKEEDKKIAENEMDKKDLNLQIGLNKQKLEGSYFTDRMKAADKELEAAQRQIEASRIQQQRGYDISNNQRSRELEDRKYDLEDKERQTRQQQEEAKYGYLAKKGANTENLDIAKQRQKKYEDELEKAKDKELARLREANPGKEYTNIENVKEEDLSAEFLDKRGYLEGKIQSYKSNIVSLENEKFNIDLEGDARRAELMKTARQGGSRLTALGIGGGDSTGFLRKTADNTAKIKDILTEIKTMKGLGSNREMKGLGSIWTMN